MLIPFHVCYVMCISNTSIFTWELNEDQSHPYIQLEGEESIELELNIHELVDVASGTNYEKDFDLNVDMVSMMLLHIH